MRATRPYIPRITLVFDFDKTLASSTIDVILEQFGLARSDWDRDFVGALGGGWDDIIKRGQALIDAGQAVGRPLTLELLREAATSVRPYNEVLDMPDRLRAAARTIHEPTEVEFIILSSGYAEVIEPTEVARRFDRVFASGFMFRDDQAVCVKRIIDHPEKALYLDAIGKSEDISGANAPRMAGRPIDEHDRHVLFDQMVYVGDGASDLQAFGFLEGEGGIALAIAKDGKWEYTDQQLASQRVENVAEPDYAENAELFQSLRHAVEACAARIALRSLGQGE